MLGGEGRKPGAGAKGEGSESRGRGGPPDQEIPGEPSLSRALGPAWPLIPPLTSFGAPPWIAGGSWGVFSSPVRWGGQCVWTGELFFCSNCLEVGDPRPPRLSSECVLSQNPFHA